jgi:hypothetical protein
MPRKTENQLTDVVVSLERLNCSNHGTKLRKHKAESQNPGKGKKKHTNVGMRLSGLLVHTSQTCRDDCTDDHV